MVVKEHDTPINIFTLREVVHRYLILVNDKDRGRQKSPPTTTCPWTKPPNKPLTMQ